MTTMNVLNVCNYLYPNQMKLGNIEFGANATGLPWITKWTVPNIEQPTIDYLVSQIPVYQKQFDLDYFKSIGNVELMVYLDSVAGERQYSSAVSCASYNGSTIPQWKAEADAFVAWRDAVFVYTMQQILLMQNDERSIPAFAEFKTELPSMVWP